MIRLNVLRLSVLFWRYSLFLSRKLSTRTWVVLALVNTAMAVFSFWAYFAKSVPESAIPPVYYVDRNLIPMPPPTDVPRITEFTWVSAANAKSNQSFALVIDSSASVPSHSSCVVYVMMLSASDPAWVNGGTHLHWEVRSSFQQATTLTTLLEYGPSDWRLPALPRAERIVLALPSDAPNLLTPVQQVVAIFVGIFTTFLSILNTFFAWQVYRRAKAQEILMQLQIAKLRAEIAEYEVRAHKERGETGIILVS